MFISTYYNAQLLLTKAEIVILVYFSDIIVLLPPFLWTFYIFLLNLFCEYNVGLYGHNHKEHKNTSEHEIMSEAHKREKMNAKHERGTTTEEDRTKRMYEKVQTRTNER